MRKLIGAVFLVIAMAIPAVAHDSHAHSTPPPQGSGSGDPSTVTNTASAAGGSATGGSAVGSSSSNNGINQGTINSGAIANASGGTGGAGGAGGNSSSNAKQSQVANGGAGGSANNNGNAQSTNISTPRDAAPAAPVFVSETSPCRIGVGGSFSFLTGGGAAGTSRADKSCQDLEIAKTLYQMGEKSSAILMVCHTAEARKAKLPLCSSGATIQ